LLLIIGASGVIGRALMAEVKKDGIPYLGTFNKHNNSEFKLSHFDISNNTLGDLIKKTQGVKTVILLAAYTNPTWIANNKSIANNVNVVAIKNFIDQVVNYGLRFIFVSSMEVFDGTKGNYKENDLPSPINTYGKMKLEIEKYISGLNIDKSVVRLGWNVGGKAADRCPVSLTYETLTKPGAIMAKDNLFSIVDVRDTAVGLKKIALEPLVNYVHIAPETVISRVELANVIIRSSVNKNLMKFKVGKHTDIKYNEPRGKNMTINADTSNSLFKIHYRTTTETITDKVTLIDEYHGKINGR